MSSDRTPADLPVLIGITGQKQAGKDTIAAALAASGYARIGFADALKEMAIRLGWDGRKDDQGFCEACGMLQGRQLLQVLGTEAARDVLGENVWVDVVRRKITGSGEPYWVIPDVRYENEAAMVRDLGGVIWRVVRPGFEGDGHASETAMRRIVADWQIHNHGDIARLNQEVEFALEAMTHGDPVATH